MVLESLEPDRERVDLLSEIWVLHTVRLTPESEDPGATYGRRNDDALGSLGCRPEPRALGVLHQTPSEVDDLGVANPGR